MTADKVRWELATAVRDIKEINAGVQMQTIALPYGEVPKDGALDNIMKGEDKGTAYENVGIFKAAWRPNLSPITKMDKSLEHQPNYCVFNPMGIERSVPDPRKATSAGTFEYWLQWFDKNPSERYVSDGNAKVAAVPVFKK